MVRYSASLRATSLSISALTLTLIASRSSATRIAGKPGVSARNSTDLSANRGIPRGIRTICVQTGSTSSCRHPGEGLHHRAEELQAVGAAQLRLGAALRVGHHAQHVALPVDDPGDAVDGA